MHEAALRPWSPQAREVISQPDHGRRAGSLVPLEAPCPSQYPPPDVPSSRRVLTNGQIAARCSRCSGGSAFLPLLGRWFVPLRNSPPVSVLTMSTVSLAFKRHMQDRLAGRF